MPTVTVAIQMVNNTGAAFVVPNQVNYRVSVAVSVSSSVQKKKKSHD